MAHYKFSLLLAACAWMGDCGSTYAQISKGGEPYSFSAEGLRDEVAQAAMSPVDTASLLAEDDSIAATGIPRPFRFGHAMDVDLSMDNSGTWDTLQGGDRLWRLEIASAGAYSINLIFDGFHLPEGATFFVYSKDRNMALGAFTADISNNEHGVFATDLVRGNAIVLEYYEPAHASGGIVNVDKVIHGYINTFSNGLGSSGSCNVDINCAQGDDWCVEKRAVSMILVDDNTALCTGCLLNNVREDLTPYYLTAFHCVDTDVSDDSISQTESAAVRTWIFRFKYWRPECNGENPGHWVSITGADLRANHHPTDMVLLELNARPPSGFGVLYAGWDRNTNPPNSGVGIHHPSGDVMKISQYVLPATPVTVGAYSLWHLSFLSGITEPGSSGSPLFNQNQRVVGQLLGTYTNNPISCSNPFAPVLYGRFDISWTGGGTPQTRLRDWLDPDNTGAMQVAATGPETFLINRTLFWTHGFNALEDVHIEGLVNESMGGILCPPSNVLFTAQSGSNVTVRGQNIRVFGGTQFLAGSNVRLISSGINCPTEVAEGDYVDTFCDADVSNKRGQNVRETDNDSEEREIPAEGILVYPNPSNGRFTIESVAEITQVEVWSVTGRQVSVEAHEPNKRVDLNINRQPDGLYLIRVTTAGGILTKRVVKTAF